LIMNSDYFKDKRVLVAGGSGFVGTNLTASLLLRGAQVRSTYYKKSPRQRLDEVEYVPANLLLESDCKKATKDIDFVFMAAAESSGAAVMEKTPLVHLTPNIIMNAQMLAAAYENKVGRFCFISSNTVYPVTDFAVKEDDAEFDFFEKYFIVGWMKRFSEIMCEMYSSRIENTMETVTVRPGNLYGPFDKFNYRESKAIAALIRRAIEAEDPFLVWGDGYDIKDFLYIDDFIEGLLLVFEHAKDFKPVNIASGQPITIRQVVEVILECTGYKPTNLKFDSSKPTMIPKRLIDTKRISKLTAWTPKTTLKDGISNTVIWYKEMFKGKTPEEIET